MTTGGDEKWDGLERRDGNRGLLFEMISEVSKKIDQHIDDSIEWREQVAARLTGDDHLMKQFTDAFPGGDTRGHREYHDSLIEKEKARKEFWQKLAFEIARAGLIGFAAWALHSLWMAFLKGPK